MTKTFNTYDEACESIDALDLIAHCKEGAEENNHMHDARFSDWSGGAQIVSVYLEDNSHVFDDAELRGVIESALDDWLSSSECDD